MKNVFGYSVSRSKERDYQFLYLRLRMGEIADAARTYKRDGTPAALNTLATVRQETGDTLFFHEQRDNEITIKWQTNHDAEENSWRQWYGCQIDGGDFKPAPLSMLIRIVKSLQESGFYTDPGATITAIAHAGGVAIKHADGLCLDEWLIDTTNAPLDAIIIEQPVAV